MSDPKTIEKVLACEPGDQRNPATLVQMLTILADNAKDIPADYVCDLTAGVQHYEPMGRECFVLAIKGTLP